MNPVMELRRSARRRSRVAAGLVTLWVLVFAAVSIGPVSAETPRAVQSPSPSGSPSAEPSASPTAQGPQIQLLNPNATYDPGLPLPPRDPDAADRPKISDRFDGVDSAYHVTAVTKGAPDNAIVEAYVQYGTNNEITVGTLDRVPGSPNLWELFWDIPNTLNEGNATFRVRLYEQTASGVDEIAADEVLVDMQYRDPGPSSLPTDTPADETIELTWPTNGGQLGFNKPRTGTWQTVIDAYASSRTEVVEAYYSTTPIGEEPEYVKCALINLYNTPQYDSDPSIEIPFQAPCALASGTLPSEVTAVAVVSEETDLSERDESQTGNEVTQDSADAHVVVPYLQDVSTMTTHIESDSNSQQPPRARRVAGSGCLAFFVVVEDAIGRPVNGVNVDVHAQGPNDQLQFGDESTAGFTSGGKKNPDKGTHKAEAGRDCDANANQGSQGDHNVPGGPDIKHLESTAGTGIGAGDSPSGTPPLVGRWRFHLWSATAGISNLTAWVDEEPLEGGEAGTIAVDDDELKQAEASATYIAQWYPSAPTLTIEPVGGSAPIGTCARYVAKARAGNALIKGINIDVHAAGPNDDLDFCDPSEATPRRAPDKPESGDGAHTDEDAGESFHPVNEDADIQHTEGETADSGNFVFGIASAVKGDTSITAWIDGEKDGDNNFDSDTLDTGEPTATIGHSWVGSLEDASISFLNPSAYGGGGTKIANNQDADSTFEIVTRVDTPDLVPSVNLSFSSDGTTFTPIGTAQRVQNTDTYALMWDVAVADGAYTLRADIPGTSISTEIDVTVKNEGTSPVDPNDIAFETAQLTRPLNGAQAPFQDRATEVEGVASAGADGLEVYYTKVPAQTTPAAADWIRCAYIDLSGSGSASQPFQGKCALTGSDQPSQVSGIAVITFDCQEPVPGAGCNGAPGQTPARQGAVESGNAHRVFGLVANPLISIEPAEAQQAPGQCQRFVLRVTDQTGQGLGGANTDVHITGPGDGTTLCEPPNGSSAHTSPDQGGHVEGSHPSDSGPDTLHIEGQTSTEGTFVFGVTSPDEGDTQIVGWIDQADDDVQGVDEPSDTSLMHWTSEPTGGCTITGSTKSETLRGTSGADVICARGGADRISGLGGDDIIKGGRGKDVLLGGAGNDKLLGGRNNDTLRGGPGDDQLNGGRGRDRCAGGDGNDTSRSCERGKDRSTSGRIVNRYL